jgi:hypothetical protein
MTKPVTAFKSLAPNEYTITPFRAYSPHLYTYVSGSVNNSVDVNFLFGRKYTTASGLRVENAEQELFDSVIQTFYSVLPSIQYGITPLSYIPTGSVYVISVTQDIFGEQVQPNTVKITIGTSSSYDDGRGNMFVSSSVGSGSIVGSIFYDKGIILLKPTSSIAGGGISNDGVYVGSGSAVQVQFSSSVMLREHAVRVRINPSEYNYSLYNPTTNKTMYTGSASLPRDLMASQSLLPYITTIGLYNDANELVAVGKLSNPIQRTSDSTQTFVVKFDT